MQPLFKIGDYVVLEPRKSLPFTGFCTFKEKGFGKEETGRIIFHRYIKFLNGILTFGDNGLVSLKWIAKKDVEGVFLALIRGDDFIDLNILKNYGSLLLGVLKGIANISYFSRLKSWLKSLLSRLKII